MKALTAEVLWGDFTIDFSPMGIHNMSNTSLKLLRDILRQYGVFVRTKRGLPRKTALQECWKAEECPKISPNATTHTTTANDDDEHTDDHHDDNNPDISRLVTTERGDKFPHRQSGISTTKDWESVIKNKKAGSDTGNDRRPDNRGIEGLVKAYSGRTKYSGKYDEDLANAIQLYELTADMCTLSPQQRRNGIMVMLTGNALDYYATSLKHLASYEDVIKGLTDWFTSAEQKKRLLGEWNCMKLSDKLKGDAVNSQVGVFREMASQLTNIQRQLHTDYHKDRILTDKLVMATDNFPDITKAFKQNYPSTSQEAIQRIAGLLSHEPQSARNSSQPSFDDGNMYFEEQKLGGKAERNFKGAHKRRDRKKTSWKVKGCWVCGGDHLARDKHRREEVSKAI